jgi:prepilin-type N-terminal cleavage/methylation domain-containing protein
MRAISAIERDEDAGFTLIELLVALVILVLAAALLPMAFNRFVPARAVSVTSERLVDSIREAQMESQRTGEPISVRLRDGGVEWGGRSVAFPARVSVVAVDSSGRELEEVPVFPDGSARGARFEIRSSTRYSVVVVSGITGHTSVLAHP